MKKIAVLFLVLKFLLFAPFLKAQEGIKINYEFEDKNPDWLKAQKIQGNVVLNFGYFSLEGNNSFSKFYDVEDLRYDNRFNDIVARNSPIKQVLTSTFYSGAFYTDFANHKEYQKLTMDGKTVLVPDSLKTIKWKIKRATKKVLNFDTRLATFEDSAKTVEAWYAPKLPFKIGPLNYNQLPGAVLELTIRFKNPSIKSIKYLYAKDVEYLKKVDATIPKDLKIVSKEVYKKDLEKKRKRYKEMMDQGVDTDDD